MVRMQIGPREGASAGFGMMISGYPSKLWALSQSLVIQPAVTGH
jgi:hypothetical protein